MTWLPAIRNTLPRSDGSHANDWVTEPYVFPPTIVRRRLDAPRGPRRMLAIEVRITHSSGSGSNSWAIRPVIILNEQRPSDSWDVFEVTPGIGAGVAPVAISDTDLPFSRVYRVPLRLCMYALAFTRSGAGTNVLNVRCFAIGGAAT